MKNIISLAFMAIFSFSTKALAEQCPMTNAAILSASKGETYAELSQSFIIPPAYEQIAGRVKFLTNEGRDDYIEVMNDSFLATVSSKGLFELIAQGDFMSMSSLDFTSVEGYILESDDIPYSVDMSGLTGEVATINFALWEADERDDFKSGLAIDTISVVRTERLVHAGSGYLNGGGKIQDRLGQLVNVTLTNKNVLGTTVQVRHASSGQSHGAIILPGSSVTFQFQRWGPEPMQWNFDVSTVSDAMLVSYDIESSWIDGMPYNPCF